MLLQAEVQAKVAHHEKHRQSVANAQKLNQSLNRNKLKIDDFIAQSEMKMARLDELEKSHPKLQQVQLLLHAVLLPNAKSA